MSLLRRLTGRAKPCLDRRQAGGKDPMPEATPPAAGGTPDVAALTASVTKLTELVSGLASAQADITKTLGAITESIKKPEAGADTGKKDKGEQTPAVTLEQIGQLIDQKLGATQKASESKAARDAYLAEKLKDVPAAYRAQLGSDPTKWASEEQAIREQFKADLKAQGVEPKTLGNASADGGVTPEKRTIDRSKMSPLELLNSDAGLKPASAAK
jgi:hypothetical protein